MIKNTILMLNVLKYSVPQPNPDSHSTMRVRIRLEHIVVPLSHYINYKIIRSSVRGAEGTRVPEEYVFFKHSMPI